MRIGYARVSTTEQNSDLQRRALREAGCIRIFEDHGISGSRADRKGLIAALALARSGDHLVVWRLDRLGRSLAHLIEMITGLQDRGVGLSSLREQIDTTSAGGRFYLHILAALAEFERELIRDRTKAGLQAAKLRGVRLGRPPKLSHADLMEAAAMIAAGQSRQSVAATFNISALTLRRAMKRHADEPDGLAPSKGRSKFQKSVSCRVS